jgi:hypothetical protein
MQTEFPFSSLDFPGRVTLRVDEVAKKVDVTSEHVRSLIDEKIILGVINVRGAGQHQRGHWRITLEGYHHWILTANNGIPPTNLFRRLCEAVRALPMDRIVELRNLCDRLIKHGRNCP